MVFDAALVGGAHSPTLKAAGAERLQLISDMVFPARRGLDSFP